MSSYESNNISLGPDWLRNKPVFSKHRWGQEELLGLSQNVGACPESLLACEDLAASVALPPVNYTQFTEEEKELLERGPVTERGRGRGRGTRGGARRSYDSSYSRRDDNRDHSRSADCDNWRRRDPDPPRDEPQSHSITTHSNSSIPPSSRPTDNVPEPGFLSRSPPTVGYNSVGDPPYYPPFPPKTVASSQPPTYPPFPVSATTPSTKPNIDHTESDSWRRDNNAAILRNISQNLESSVNTTDFQPPFSSPSQDMAPGNISSQVPQSSGPSLDMFVPKEPSSPQQNFPTLRELGATQPPVITPMSPTPPTQQTEVRGQGFLPPPAPPVPDEDIENKWYYLDPKKNTQGPFDSVMMFNWFSQGYFGMNLEIRRADDTEFKKLEDVIRDSGKIPFQPDDASPHPPIPSSTTQPARPDSAAADTRKNVWDTAPSQSIWGSSSEPEFPVTSSYPASSTGTSLPNLSPAFSTIGGHDFMTQQDEAKRAQRADDMRKEIERAMAAEQQRKQLEEEEENRKLRVQTEQQRLQNEKIVLEQQRIIHAKRHEESLKEAELARLREIELSEKKRLEEEADMLRLQKERLEKERHLQEERTRRMREEADNERREIEETRQAMEKERLKLEREKELMRQQEDEMERRRVEKAKHEEVLKERARVAEERSAAIQAAAEAKAAVQEQAATEKAAAENRAAAQREADARTKAEAEKKKAAEAASKKNVWGAVDNTTNHSGPSPWATQATPSPQMTLSATRTPTASSGKGWGKPAPPKGPSLSEIQKSETHRREQTPKYNTKAQEASRQQGTWANTASRGNQPKSLADIQREQENYLEHEESLTYSRQNQWNPVAGMLEEDQPKQKPKQQPAKPNIQQQQQQPKKGKGQQNNKHNPALMEMFNNSPRDEFTVWCEKQVMLFRNPHIDVPTFISFLRDVESPIEVREYVINFLGDTKATDDFVKDFVIKRKSMNSTNDAAFGISNLEVSKPKKAEPQITTSRKHKKKKMQKVNAASLLGINCTASSDARNRGDIDNVIIQ